MIVTTSRDVIWESRHYTKLRSLKGVLNMILKINGSTYDEIHNTIVNSENVFDVISRKIENLHFDFNENCNLVRNSVHDELELASTIFDLNVLRTSAKVFEIVSDNVLNFIDFSIQHMPDILNLIVGLII